MWVKTKQGWGLSTEASLMILLSGFALPVINNFGLGEGGRHRSNLWTYAGANTFRSGRMKDLIDHPTVKPKKMVADALLDCSRRGGIVLDVFAGSGTTLVAAAMTGRRGFGVEIDPRYADVILARMSEKTGLTPMLEA